MPSRYNHNYHKVKKVVISKKTGYTVYKCILPDCSYFIAAPLIINKTVLCWVCDKPFIIKGTLDTIRAKPHCDNPNCFSQTKGRKKTKEVIDIGFDVEKLTNLLT